MPNITSTRERLLSFITTNPDYEVVTEPVYMPELNGWLVRTTVIVHKHNTIRSYHGASFRKIDEHSIFTALETAETVSLGRCLAKMGIGIDEQFASLDELESVPSVNVETPIITDGIKKVNEAKKQKITTDTDYHDEAVAMKLAISNGDIETAKEMIEEAKEVVSVLPELVVPDREEIMIDGKVVLKRNLKLKENKMLWEKLKANGCTKETLEQWMEDVGVSYADHAEFIRYAPNIEIEEFYKYLKLNNNNDENKEEAN